MTKREPSVEKTSMIPYTLQESRTVSYVLRLNQHLSYNLVGTTGVDQWLRELAGIMGLPLGHDTNLPTLCFIRGREVNLTGSFRSWPADHSILETLEQDGWHMSDLRLTRIWWHPNQTEVVCELLNIPLEHLEGIMRWQALHPVYEQVITRGGIPLHSALAEHQRQGILLAGAGGRGKSTCCARLPETWTPLSDDQTLLVKTHKGTLAAHPFPTWNASKAAGKQWNVSVNLRPAAIFFLEQAAQDRAIPLGRAQAAARMNESANQSCSERLKSLSSAEQRTWRSTLFENACEAAKAIPAFTLRVTRNGRFWRVIEEVLKRG